MNKTLLPTLAIIQRGDSAKSESKNIYLSDFSEE